MVTPRLTWVNSDSNDRATRSENRALIGSLIASATIGTAALIWGIASGASVIVFDGVYMLAGIVLVGVSLIAARAASIGPSREHPFGLHGATPLAVALQGAALLGTLVYGCVDAISVIIGGGSEAAATQVVAYGVVSGLISVLVMVALRGPARTSALVGAEVLSWRAGALLSLVVAVGGGIGVALKAAGHENVAVYVDPTLVFVASVGIAPMALGLIRGGVRELLEAAPPAALRATIDDVVARTRETYRLPAPIVRATVLGRRLYVEVDFVVDADSWSVDAEDRVRREITDKLRALDYDVWASIEVTTDTQLAN